MNQKPVRTPLGPWWAEEARAEACSEADVALRRCAQHLRHHNAMKAAAAVERARKSVQGAERHAMRRWHEAEQGGS